MVVSTVLAKDEGIALATLKSVHRAPFHFVSFNAEVLMVKDTISMICHSV